MKEDLDFLKWQRVAQDDFDDMPCIGCRPTNIFNLSFIFLVFLFFVSLIVFLEGML